jgi:hypothetical protein
MRYSALVLILAAILTACGYLQSGRWEDDERNWERAFRTSKPEDVVVVHSQYWRSPHWTYEAGYAFEIRANPEFRERYLMNNRLRRITLHHLPDARTLCFAGCPTWFAPGSLDRYEVWGLADDQDSKFRALIDKISGTIFLVDYQV